MAQKTIDIIGTGVSGLATAYYLVKSGADVHIRLWEKDLTPGGLAGNFKTKDFSVEKFYHHLYRSDVALQKLIEELGLGDELTWRPAMTGAYFLKQPYRLSSPVDLLRYKPLPFVDRLRLAFMVCHAKTVKDWKNLDDLSAKDYIVKYAGPKVYSILWEPLLKGKFGPHAESVSAAWLWAKFIDRGSSRSKTGFEVLGYLKGGLGRLFDNMVNFLREKGHKINFNAGIERLELDADNRISALFSGGKRFSTDLVVSCVQVPDLVQLLPDSVVFYRRSLDRIKFLGNVCLVLILNKSLSDFYWTNVTDTSAPFVGIIEQTNWAQADEFKGKHLVYISAYVPKEDARMAMNAQQLFDFYLPHIQKMFPEFSAKWVEDKLAWKASYAQPIVHVGYRKVVPEIQSPVDNLLLCTMAQIYPSDRQVSNGVAMAMKTVDCINEKLAPPRRDKEL